MLTLTLTLLTGCVANNKRIINNCRQTVVTYGDAIECMIKLDELQRI